MRIEEFYNLFKHDLADLSYRTALLESCNWDESEFKNVLEVVQKYLECDFLPPPKNRYSDFDQWLTEQVGGSLQGLGITKEQARIVCDVIINRKDEFLSLQNLEEN